MTEKMAERRDKEIAYNAEQLAHALTKTLSRAPFQGKCKCGLMLTERDKVSGKHSYSCPRCGWTGVPKVEDPAAPLRPRVAGATNQGASHTAPAK
jgi:hypothetical protein